MGTAGTAINGVARRLLALAVLALLHAATAFAQPPASGAQVLAPGEPQLTQQMVDRVTTLLGDTVGQPLNARQRDRMRALYVGYWRARNRDEMQAMLDLLDLATVLDALPKAQRAETLQGFREEFLPHLRDAAKTDADARWLYALHEQSLRGAHAAGPLRVAPDTAPPPLLPAEKKPATVGAATPSSIPAVAPVTRSHAAVPAAGVTYAPPAGWTRQDNADAVVFDALLRPESRANHSARISVFRPVAAPGGIAAQFDSEWRRIVVPTAGARAGETVAYYRNRLPGGVDAYFMGRFFELPTQTQQLYVVMYVLDLGDRAQTVVATVVGAWDGVGYPGAVDDSAYQALAQSLFPLLDSIQVPGRRASGPLFGAAEVRGRWLYQDGSYGGSFVNATTGASMGAAVRGASSTLHLNADGSYRYDFAMYAVNPNAGADVGPRAEGHDGRWSFTDDVITWQPRQRVSYDPRRKVVGGGVQQTPQGPRRLLVVTSPGEGVFKPPMWVPLGARYDGIMHWYVEDGGAR